MARRSCSPSPASTPGVLASGSSRSRRDLESTPLSGVLEQQPVDLVHASAVVHHLDDEVAAIAGLAAVVRPGGRVAVIEGGLSNRYLPDDCGIGEPGLEERLAVDQAAWFWSEVRPAAATVRTGWGWNMLLAEAGLVDIRTRSFLLDLPPPLATANRRRRPWRFRAPTRPGRRAHRQRRPSDAGSSPRRRRPTQHHAPPGRVRPRRTHRPRRHRRRLTAGWIDRHGTVDFGGPDDVSVDESGALARQAIREPRLGTASWRSRPGSVERCRRSLD